MLVVYPCTKPYTTDIYSSSIMIYILVMLVRVFQVQVVYPCTKPYTTDIYSSSIMIYILVMLVRVFQVQVV